MIPWSCAASSASAICLAMGSVSSTGIWPCATRSERQPLNKLHDEGSDPISGLEPIDSGDVRVIERRENLGFTPEASEAFSIDHEGVGALIATTRFRFTSVARQTSPMPPEPIRSAISYGPRRVRRSRGHSRG